MQQKQDAEHKGGDNFINNNTGFKFRKFQKNLLLLSVDNLDATEKAINPQMRTLKVSPAISEITVFISNIPTASAVVGHNSKTRSSLRQETTHRFVDPIDVILF